MRQALKNLEKEVRDLQHEKHGKTGNKSQRLFKPSEELAYKIFYQKKLNETITVRNLQYSPHHNPLLNINHTLGQHFQVVQYIST